MEKQDLSPPRKLSRSFNFLFCVLFRVLLIPCVLVTIIGIESTATAQTEKKAVTKDTAETSAPSSTAEASDQFILEELVVTATKVGETRLQETPIPISVFNSDWIKTTASFKLDDLAVFSPNVEIRDNYYFIRGVGNQADWATVEAQVSVHMDGVFLPRGLGSQTDLFDVERVEILRGPQGTLYGQNSTGGSINIITKKPTDDLEGAVAVEYGSYQKLRFDGTLSGPLIPDKLNGRLTLKHETGETFTKVVRGPDDEDREALALRAALDFKISDTANLILRADYDTEESKGMISKVIDTTFSLYEDFGYVAPGGFYDVTRNSDMYFKIDQWGVSADLAVALPFGTLRSLTAYRNYVGEDLTDNDNSDLNLFSGYEKEDNQWASQELQLNGSTGRLDWLVGGYYYWHEELYDVWMMFPEFYGDWQLIMDGDYIATTWAVFANIDYRLTDRLNVGVGGRYTHNYREMDWNDNYSGLGSLLDDADWDKFVPRIHAEYQMTDDAMVYGVISQGFRAGTVDPVNPQAGIPSEVDAETVWNYEAGIKSDWLKNRLRINANVFYMDYEDMVMEYATVVNNIIQNIVGNAAEAEITGFELEVTARPVRGLTLSLSSGYLSTELNDFRDARDSEGNLIDASGNRLLFVPEWSHSIGAEYRFRMGDAGHLTLRGDLVYRDELFSDVENNPLYELDSQTLINAFVKYETADGHWGVDVYGKNLFDEEYYILKSAGTFGGVIGTLGSPATYGVRLTYRF